MRGRSHQITAVAAWVFAAVLLFLTTNVGFREWAIFAHASNYSVERYLGLDGSPVNIRSTSRLPGFATCVQGIPASAESDAKRRREAIDSCTEILLASLRQAPLDGDAWFAYGALLVQRDGFAEEARKAFAQSYRAAPSELWITSRRLPLMLANWELVGDDLKLEVGREVLAIAHSWQGIRSLSDLVVKIPPQNRSIVVGLLKDEPQEFQRRFLYEVQKSVRSSK